MSTNSSYSPAPIGAGTLLDEEVLVLCDTGNSGARFLRAIKYNETTGAVSTVTDTTLDGITAYVVVGPVTNCGDTITLPGIASDHFEVLTAGTAWTPAQIPAGRRLVGLAYSVLVGTATVVDATGATSIAGLPVGYSADWGVQDDRETLTGPASITAIGVGGRTVVTMTTAV